MSLSEQDAVAALTPARRTLVHPRDRVVDHGPGTPGAVCHALCVRIAGALSPGRRKETAERFAALAAGLTRSTATAVVLPGTARWWHEPVPCRSDAPDAGLRRGRELARPLVAHRDAAVRAVLLDYSDGVSELVVVAHRAVLGAAALHDFVAAVLDREPAADGSTVVPPGPAGGSDDSGRADAFAGARFDAQLDWGLGRPYGPDSEQTRVLRLPANHPAGDTASWTTALGLVLARYEGTRRPVLAAMVPDPLDPHGVEGIALVPVDADPASTLGTADKRVRATLAEGPAWHTEELRRQLEPVTGDIAAGPVVGITVHDEAVAGLPGAAPVAYRPFQRAPFPMTVSVVRDDAGRREVRCDVSTRSVLADTADRFLDHVARAHRMLITAPDLPLGELELLDEDELRQLAALGRPAPLPDVEHRRIDAAVAAVAAVRPDAVAVSFDGESITYRELIGRADGLALALRSLGVAEGDRVGVCLERSAELVVTLLAVLRAGAVYVPMDPAHPQERLAHTATDARLGTVVTDHAEFPAVDGNLTVVAPAALADLVPEECDGPPPTTSGAQDPAYVIYTSGSTGRPKGVVVPHGNVLSLMAATTEDFGLGPEDTWTLFHSSAFDFSVWEIWGCLLTGGRLVVVPYWVSRSSEEFHRLLLEERVSVLSQTPSAFAQLLEVERDGAGAVPVRLVVFGGEGLEPRVLLPWFDRHPETECRVVNMYGITETTVHVTAQTVTRAEALSGSRSVGHALPGWWVKVADPEGRPLPLGVAGEILVGGAGVASHYLNRPDLTEQRFLLDPGTGERVYRSGDKGRMLPDGRLEHLGRLDNQVKLRGFRIELDEIRAVLLDDPLVAAAAVVLNRTDPQDPATAQLDAFVVLEGEDTAAVRQRAARYLPTYMVPSTITPVDRMPLTANGKLDARRLPAPAPAARTAPVPAAGPETGVEPGADRAGDTGSAEPQNAFAAVLLDVWQDVLGTSVGPDDNFFDLGGNSLLAMRVGAALRRRGGATVSMRDLYLFPTIRRLAAERAE
ncbi:amino acid adenylation domain-containing protein [Streptomyces anulatus]|uniref:amino acid adenylation domain-containing protein n=1 Tax=Streptomyces anulatus TaxID=1892 RepID=UPI003B78CC7F